MYALAYNRDGAEQWRLELNDDATLDPDHYARIFSGLYGIELLGDCPWHVIPDGCEDIRIVVQEEPGAVRCWKSANYILGRDD